jgi:hypothetical protein
MTENKKAWDIVANWTVRKKMIVIVPEGLDPTNPKNWDRIASETDTDCLVDSVESAAMPDGSE